jgi:hypothetical protein
VSLVDLLRSVAIVFGRLNVARFVSFDLMRRCLLKLTSDMMKLEHFQWPKVLTAMLAFESIDSLMFGSLRADEMMHCHRGLATISCVFGQHLQAPVRVGCPSLPFKRCFVVSAKL